MNHLITVLLLLAFCTTAKATQCVDNVFQKKRITLYLCQNANEFNKTRALLYKARTKILNHYIEEKINNGKLKDKKFEIQINGITPGYLILSMERNRYRVWVGGYPTLQELMAIVGYFSRPDWESFRASVFDENAQEKIDEFFIQNSKNKIFTHKPFVIWEKNGVSLEYIGDSLRYLINDTPLPFLTTSNLPVKIQNRYLFFQRDSIFVMEDMQIIQSLEINKFLKDTSEDFDIQIFTYRVDIYIRGTDNWLYSYSYDKNKFFKNDIMN